jgi:hypothetical protein
MVLINIDLFNIMLECSFSSNSYHHYYPEVKCWTGAHLINSIFAVIISIIFITISLIVGLMFYDSRMTSNEMTAKSNARADVFLVFE